MNSDKLEFFEYIKDETRQQVTIST